MSKLDLIFEFVVEELNSGVDFEIDADLLQQKIIDSMGLMKLISFLEETFDVEIDMEKINPDNFSTIEKITDFVENMAEVLG